MKRIIVVLLSIWVFVFAFAWEDKGMSSATFADEIAPHRLGHKAVILLCEINIAYIPPTVTIIASDSSENAPVVPTGTSCAQALADILDAGFKIRNIQGDQYGLKALYTLVK